MHVHLCVALWLFSLHPSPVFYFVPPLFFQPFQMSSSEFNERFRSNPLCDFRLGTVATSDHETPLTSAGPPSAGTPPPGRPKFRAFFPSPAAKFVLFFPLWGSSRGFLVVFLKRRDPHICTFGELWLLCEAPAAPKPLGGFHTTERILRREREKKERNFERSRESAVLGRAVLGALNMTKPKP